MIDFTASAFATRFTMVGLLPVAAFVGCTAFLQLHLFVKKFIVALKCEIHETE